jgi:ATP-dependent Clp protease ATP-binding subunit ClpA
MRAGIKRFDQAARNVLAQAQMESVNSGQTRIRDTHLFIALVEDEGAAGKLLAEHGADLEKIRGIVKEVLPASEKTPGERGNIKLDETTQRVLESAVEIARQKNSETISAEHLLFALLKNASSQLKKVMEACGLDRSLLREQLEPLLDLLPDSSELSDLLDTLEACRHLFQGETAHLQRLGRIEEILQEYFSAK